MTSTLARATLVALVGILIAVWLMVVPHPITETQALLIPPDSWEYSYGAVALLHGHYLVDFSGIPDASDALPLTPSVPRYPPGFSALLAPAIAIGGRLENGLWVPIAGAVLLGLSGALVAARVSRAAAAPLAIVLVMYTPAVAFQSQVVMSDLVSAAAAMVAVLLLTFGRRSGFVLLAGLLIGGMVWMRYSNVAMVPAGLLATTALGSGWRKKAGWYLTGAVPPLIMLAVWQFVTFGSPFMTTYQAVPPALNRINEYGSFFASRFVFGPPFARDPFNLGGLAKRLALPNAILYPFQLIGGDPYLFLPGVGAVGLFGAVRFARRSGPSGVLGRFAIVATLFTLLLYLPYYYQSGRFFQAPVGLLAVIAAAMLIDPLLQLARRVLSVASNGPARSAAENVEAANLGRLRLVRRTAFRPNL